MWKVEIVRVYKSSNLLYEHEDKVIFEVNSLKEANIQVQTVLKKAETGADMVVCDVARKRLRWDYSRWSYSIGKDSMYVAILRDVGDGNVQRTEFRHVRENHRIISKECTVLAKTHAKGKRLR